MSIELIIFLVAWLITAVIFVYLQGSKGVVKGLGGGFILGCLAFIAWSELNEPADKIIDKSGFDDNPIKTYAFKRYMDEAKLKFDTEFLTMKVIKYSQYKTKSWSIEAEISYDNKNGYHCIHFTSNYSGNYGLEMNSLIKEYLTKDCEN